MKRYWVRLGTTAVLAVVLAWEILPGIDAVPQTRAENLEPIDVEGQPLASNVAAPDSSFGASWNSSSDETRSALEAAGRARDAREIQQVLDRQVLFAVHLNPEVRVKVTRGPAPAILQQSGFTPFLVKVVNESAIHSAAEDHQSAIWPCLCRCRQAQHGERTAGTSARERECQSG